ncbi:MAG: hypothetical protein ACXWZ7_15650, partial [Gemmatirosa sp.]
LVAAVAAAALAPAVASPLVASLGAQQPAPAAASGDPRRLTVERIFGGRELAPAGAPGLRWMRDGRSYVEARTPAGGQGTELVRVDVLTGAATVLVPASVLVDERGRAIAVEDFELAPDERKALLFHGSVRVWRTNTRGTYHVVDFDARRVIPVAVPAKAGITTTGAPASQAAARWPRRRSTRTPHGNRSRASSDAGWRAARPTRTCSSSRSSRPTRARSRTCARTICG